MQDPDVVMQELLLRQCKAALQAWKRIAALERRRDSMMSDCFRQNQMVQTARLAMKAWHQLSEAAAAQAAFILQSLPAHDWAVLRTALRGWRGRCQLLQRVIALRYAFCSRSCHVSCVLQDGQTCIRHCICVCTVYIAAPSRPFLASLFVSRQELTT